MVKQKVVIKVQMEDPKKRSKVLQTVAKHAGVASIGIEGDDKVAVVGEGIDAAELTVVLRKKMQYADVVAVAPVEEKDGKGKGKDKDKGDGTKSSPPGPPFVVPQPYPLPPYYYCVQEPTQPPERCIL